MNKNGFEYYHIVKNEDAHPFSHLWEKGDGFIVAADGLGGSGSTVHCLSDDQYDKLADTLPGIILPEYYDEDVTFVTVSRTEEARFNPATEMYEEVDVEDLVDKITAQCKGIGEASDKTAEETVDAEIAETADETTEEPIEENAEESIEENAEESIEEISEEPVDETADGNDADEPTEAPPAKPPVIRDTPFDKWLEKQFAPMIDRTPDTSALWGSRIAISRFAFYMLANPKTDLSRKEDRAALTAFIYKGMQAVIDHYGLSAGSISGQSVLPTTLVGIRFHPEDDGQMLFETVWAGDSRAYAFIPGQGMKQLSVDDEDESGSICNLFSMGRSNAPFATDLHYVAYRLPAKSAIFVCSDGVFDPYAPIDNIGVEAMFLDALKDADSFESLGEAWHALYSPMQHDDTSVAFRAFGFDSFEEFKGSFLPAYDDVVNAYNGYHDGKKIYPIIIGEEEHPQVYIQERAAKRKEQIAGVLAANILDSHAAKDVTVTPNLREAYEILKASRRTKELKSFLDDAPEKAEEVFRYPAENAQDACSQAVRKLIDGARSVQEAVAMPKKVKEKHDGLVRKGDALAAAIDQRSREVGQLRLKCIEGNQVVEAVGKGLQDFYTPQIYSEHYSRNIVAVGSFFTNRINLCTKAQRALETVREYWEDRISLDGLHARAADPGRKVADNGIEYLVFFPTDLHFFEEMREILKDYLTLKEQLQDYSSDYQQMQIERYQEMVKGMDEGDLFEILSNPALYLTDTALALFGDGAEISCDELTEAFVNLFGQKPKYFDEVIAVLSTASEPTILDSIFNPGRLKLVRTFNSFDQDVVLENRKTVDAMLAAYEDVKDWIAG